LLIARAYARILTILAKVVNYKNDRNSGPVTGSAYRTKSCTAGQDSEHEYEALLALLDYWKTDLPETCQPAYIIKPKGAVFETIWFTYSAAGISTSLALPYLKSAEI
jgi:hypothetical protein